MEKQVTRYLLDILTFKKENGKELGEDWGEHEERENGKAGGGGEKGEKGDRGGKANARHHGKAPFSSTARN